MRKLWIGLIFILILLTACSSEKEVRSIKLAHSLSPSHPVHLAMEYMAKQVDSLSEGQMRLDIYPSEQLGSERECMELLQLGSIGMTKVSASPLSQFVNEYKVFSVPYIFRDRDHFFSVLEGKIGKEILLSGTEKGLRGLCYYDAGSRSFYSTEKMIQTPQDIKGMNIRVMEDAMAMEMIRQMGGSPTPISWGELYTSLQQGIVDAAENNFPSYYLSHHFEVAKYYSLDAHTSIPDVLLMSSHVWKKLSSKEKEVIQIAANKSAQREKILWQEARQEARTKVKEAGVEIYHPDKSLFQKKVEPLYEQIKQNRPEIYAYLKRIRGVK
ncbi:MAG: TRAP transporter substrate-binding protein [Candidatus Marinimicrobia bacterium]|nr:TRAP transporter substrate-binding protein [Candidatus Neomarinimicrobiota bacterium]